MALAVAAPPETTTVDAFLGGRVEAVQPAAGHHRAGLEAVLLAAAIEPSFAGTVVDLGAGTGVAGLAVAARCPDTAVVLAERDPTAVACARASLSLTANRAFAARVRIAAVDITWPEAARAEAGLTRASASAVIVNPPFNRQAETFASPRSARAAAHVLGNDGLEPWLRAAASVLRPNGRLVVIFRADGLDALLAACRDRFGALAILPVAPRAGEAASRVLVAAVKGSHAGTRLLPPLVLHHATGSAFRPEIEAILRQGAALPALTMHGAGRR
jgi:tRNA1(Val) A37 N6-methylase TrmN6